MKRIYTLTLLLLALATVGNAQFSATSLIMLYKCNSQSSLDLYASLDNYTFTKKEDAVDGKTNYYYESAIKSTPTGAKNAYPNQVAAVLKDGAMTLLTFFTPNEELYKKLMKDFFAYKFVETGKVDKYTVYQSIDWYGFKVAVNTKEQSINGDVFTGYLINILPQMD